MIYKGVITILPNLSDGLVETEPISRGMTIYRILKTQVKLDQFNYWNNRESYKSAKQVDHMMMSQRVPLVIHQLHGVIIKYRLCPRHLISLAQALIGSYVYVRLAMIFGRNIMEWGGGGFCNTNNYCQILYITRLSSLCQLV